MSTLGLDSGRGCRLAAMQRSGLVEIRRHLNGMASEMEDWAEDDANDDDARLEVRSWAQRIRLEIQSVQFEIDHPDHLYRPVEAEARSKSAGRLVKGAFAAMLVLIPVVADADDAWSNTRAAVEYVGVFSREPFSDVEEFRRAYTEAVESDGSSKLQSWAPVRVPGGKEAFEFSVSFSLDQEPRKLQLTLHRVENEVSIRLLDEPGSMNSRSAPLDDPDFAAQRTFLLINESYQDESLQNDNREYRLWN